MAVGTYVGDFLSPNAATGNQDIPLPSGCPDLTAAPSGSWAVICWYTTAQASPATNTWYSHISSGFGFAANGGGTLAQFAVGSNSDDAVNPANANRRTASALITQPTGAASPGTQDEALFVSFIDATHMRLNWTTKVAGSRKINFMILTGLTGAKAINTVLGGSTGTSAITGAGFAPDLVLHATAETPSGGNSSTHGLLAIGALNKHGQQWANGFWQSDNVSPTITSRHQQTDACLAVVRSDVTQERTEIEAKFSSIDSGGYTVNITTNNVGGTWQLISLCLGGVSSNIGAVKKITSGTSQAVDKIGFQPKGLLMTSVSSPILQTAAAHAIFGLGAADSSNSRFAGFIDEDNLATSNADSIWLNNKIFAILRGPTTATQQAALTSFDTDGFTLTWAAVDGTADELLYLAIGDAGTNTFPAKVEVSGIRALATAYANQKHLMATSTGVLWAVRADDTAHGYPYYSTDNGVTWTYEGQDIAGWLNGSIACYVDSGGTERIVAVWKQSGTGGSRTDLHIYVMVGAFNSGRTAITWGSALELYAGQTLMNVPDVVAHAEGTGGKAHVVYSYADFSTLSQANYNPVTINSSGVPTVGALTQLGGNYLGNLPHSYPSIDYDPVTKHLYCAWSAGKTGSGFGIRFKKATYSAGTWTWGTERELSSTVIVDTNDNQSGIVCRWDGLRPVVGMAQSTGARNVWESTDDFATVVTALISSSVGTDFGIGMIIDTVTRDIYFLQSNYASGIGYDYVSYIRYIRASTSVQAVKQLGYGPTLNTSTTHGANGIFSGSTLRWVYTVGNNSPFAVMYDQIVLNVAPNTPTNLQRTGANTDTTPNFSADISDPNTTQQIKGRFQIYQSDGVTLIGTVDSAFRTGAGNVTAEYTSALAVGTYKVKVATVDDLGLISAYTSLVTFTVTTDIAKDSIELWNVRQNVSVDSTELWNVALNGVKDIGFRWDTRVNVTPLALTLLWAVYNPWIKVEADPETPPLWTEVAP